MVRLSLFSLSLLVLSGSGMAAVLIQDDFSPTSGTLHGTFADVSLSGNAWLANSGYTFTAAGKVTNSSAGTNIGATIDMGSAGYFASNPGVYTVSMDVFFPSGTSGNAVYGIGFGATASVNGGESYANAGYFGEPWIFLRANGQAQVRSNGNNLLASEATGFTNGTIYNLRLVLDTSLTAWTLDAFVGNTQLDLNGATAGSTYAYLTNPTGIRNVGIAATQTGGVGTLDNFQLTGPIPEPSSAVLSSLGLLAFCFSRKRR